MTKKYQCGVCGYIHNGDSPPHKCPKCGALHDEFEEVEGMKVVDDPLEEE